MFATCSACLHRWRSGLSVRSRRRTRWEGKDTAHSRKWVRSRTTSAFSPGVSLTRPSAFGRLLVDKECHSLGVNASLNCCSRGEGKLIWLTLAASSTCSQRAMLRNRSQLTLMSILASIWALLKLPPIQTGISTLAGLSTVCASATTNCEVSCSRRERSLAADFSRNTDAKSTALPMT